MSCSRRMATERLGGELAREVVVRAVEQEAPLAVQQRERVVVSLLEALAEVALGHLEPRGVEAGRAQHLEVEVQGLFEHPGRAAQRSAGTQATGRGRELGAEEVHALVEGIRRELLRTAAQQHGRGQPGDADPVGGIEVLAGAERHGHIDQRQRVVLDHVDHHPVRQHVPVGFRRGDLEALGIEAQLSRVRGKRLAGRRLGRLGGRARAERRERDGGEQGGASPHTVAHGTAPAGLRS